jgi:hypothetical protein
MFGPDYITKIYRSVPIETLNILKQKAKNFKGITVKSVPMPRSLDCFRVTIKFDSKVSWFRSSELSKGFYSSLEDATRLTLSYLLETTK